jgi:hypothetical protein
MFYLLVALIFSSVPKDAAKISVDYNQKPYFEAQFAGHGELKTEMKSGSISTAKLDENNLIVDGKKVDVLERLGITSVGTISDLDKVNVIDRGEYQWQIIREPGKITFKALKNGRLDQLYVIHW